MPYPFGRDFTYSFYALIDNEFENLSAISAAEAIYVYKDKPSRTEAAAGTGSALLATITTWSNTADANGKYFTIPAIDDPDPTSTIDRDTYWLAVNFKFSAAEQTQTVLRALPMQRVDAWHKVISTAQSDLESIFADVDSYASATRQDNAIAIAKEKLEQEFEAAGFDWALIWRPDKLNLACAYLALSSIMFGLGAGDPKWFELANEYRNAAKGITDGIKLEYDRLRQGEPTTVEAQHNYMRVVR